MMSSQVKLALGIGAVIVSYIGIIVSLNSCAYMTRSVVAPNSCKKCEVIDNMGTIVWSEDECGGGVHNMELRCKAEAYDYGCDHKCSCESYRKEEEE